MVAKMTTHAKIIHVMKRTGWNPPYAIQELLRRTFKYGPNACLISESSLTRRLREMKTYAPIEMKRANKSGAQCVYRLRRS